MVCINHFLQSDITKSNRLRKGVVPKVFNSSDISETITAITDIRTVASISCIASDCVDGVQTVPEIQNSTEISEIFDSIGTLDLLPTTGAGGVQVVEKNDLNQLNSCCEIYHAKLLKQLEQASLVEKIGNNVQLYKLEDNIKNLKTIIQNQTSNLRRLNNEIIQKNGKLEKFQKLLENLQQQSELNKTAIEISEVRIVRNGCSVVLIFYFNFVFHKKNY